MLFHTYTAEYLKKEYLLIFNLYEKENDVHKEDETQRV